MRIIIQIDDLGTRVTTQGGTGEGTPESAGGAGGSGPTGSGAPAGGAPAAIDAGPAPTGPPADGSGPYPFTGAAPAAPATGHGDLSAGAAPGASSRAPALVVEQPPEPEPESPDYG